MDSDVPVSQEAASSAPMQDDEDVCKICRTEADAESGPLYTPCKCKGTIGRVHATCLMDWLAATNPHGARTERCEVCGTAYRFHKVYAKDVPNKLPLTVIVKRIVISACWAHVTALRALLVAFCWIGLLPWCTVWMWRLYFWSGANSAAAVAGILNGSSDRLAFSPLSDWTGRGVATGMNVTSNATLVNATETLNATALSLTNNATSNATVSSWSSEDWASLAVTMGRDCFSGQIITCAVVVIFISVFMLREWIQQQILEDAAARDRQQPQPPPVERGPPPNVEAVQRRVMPLPPPQNRLFDDQQGNQVPVAVNPLSIPDITKRSELQDSLSEIQYLIDRLSRGNLSLESVTEQSGPLMLRIRALSFELQSSGDAGYHMALIEHAENVVKAAHDQLQSYLNPPEETPALQLEDSAIARHTSVRSPTRVPGESPSDVISTSFNQEAGPSSQSATEQGASSSYNLRSRVSAASAINKSPSSTSELPTVGAASNEEPAEWQEVLRRRRLRHRRSASNNTPASPVGSSSAVTRRHHVEKMDISPSREAMSALSLDGQDNLPQASNARPAHGEDELFSPSSPTSAPASNDAFSDTAEIGSSREEQPETNESSVTMLFHSHSHDLITGHSTVNGSPLAIAESSTRNVEADRAAPPALAQVQDAITPQEVAQQAQNARAAREGAPTAPAPAPATRIAPPATAEDPMVELQAWMDEEVHDDDEDSDVAEDEDAGIANADMDDLDGILEAIGFRGSLLALFQLVCLMIFLMGLTLSVSLWAPYMLGRTFLLSDASYHLVVGPIRLVRLVTDPIVDLLTAGIDKFIVFAASRLSSFSSGSRKYDQLLDFTMTIMQPALRPLFGSPSVVDPTEIVHGVNEVTAQSMSSAATSISAKLATTWAEVGRTTSTADRIGSILVGYTLAASCLTIWYLRDRSLARPWSRSFQESLEQQAILVKVAMFVVVELIGFPALCGLLLSIVSLPLFPETTIATRLEYYQRAPISALFFTWTMGTLFMFVVAQWISLCRGNLRKGSLYFIRDPKDPDSHPIKEMIDASVSLQAGKLSRSIFLYSTLVVAFALTALILQDLLPNVLPLRLHYRNPLSVLPIDLIIADYLIPRSLAYVRPFRIMRRLFRIWTVTTAHQLRLSSFLLGTRVPSEEGTDKATYWRYLIRLRTGCLYTDYRSWKAQYRNEHWKPSGQLARVPAKDSIKLPPGRPSTIPVNGDGSPMTAEGAENIAAHSAHGSSEADWQIVYLPPYFRFRLVLAMYLLWLTASVFFVTITVMPLIVGRGLLALLVDDQVHDGYAFLLGSYAVFPVIFGLYRFRRRYKSYRARLQRRLRRRRTQKSLKPPVPWKAFLRNEIVYYSTLLSSLAILVLSGLVVLPLLAGLAFKIYILVPLSHSSGQSLVINIPECWVYGLLFGSIIFGLSTYRRRPGSETLQHFDRTMYPTSPVETSLYCRNITKLIVWPMIKPLAVYVFLPGLSFVAANAVTRLAGINVLSEEMRMRLVRISYQIYFVYANLDKISGVTRRFKNKWLQNAKDSEYLLERRIQNYVEPSDKKKNDNKMH